MVLAMAGAVRGPRVTPEAPPTPALDQSGNYSRRGVRGRGLESVFHGVGT